MEVALALTSRECERDGNSPIRCAVTVAMAVTVGSAKNNSTFHS